MRADMLREKAKELLEQAYVDKNNHKMTRMQLLGYKKAIHDLFPELNGDI